MEIKRIEDLIERNQKYLIDEESIKRDVELYKVARDIVKDVLQKEAKPDKYIVSGCEGLSFAVKNLIESGFGFYIVGYAHKFGINHSVDGFKTKEELMKYAEWAVEQYNETFLKVEADIEEMKIIEDTMTAEERSKKYVSQLEAQTKILENIFDFEGKKKYCEEARQLETIHSKIQNFIKISSFLEPVYNELVILN
jgi:hypothetical protein